MAPRKPVPNYITLEQFQEFRASFDSNTKAILTLIGEVKGSVDKLADKMQADHDELIRVQEEQKRQDGRLTAFMEAEQKFGRAFNTTLSKLEEDITTVKEASEKQALAEAKRANRRLLYIIGVLLSSFGVGALGGNVQGIIKMFLGG